MALSSHDWHGMPCVCPLLGSAFYFLSYFYFASCVRAFSSSLSCRLLVISYSVSVTARESNSNGDFMLKVTLFCQKWFYSHFIFNDIPAASPPSSSSTAATATLHRGRMHFAVNARIFIQFCDSYTCPTMIHLVTDCKQTHTHNDIDINIARLDCSFSFHVIWLFHVRIHGQSEYILYLLFPLNKSVPASFSSLFVFFFFCFFRNIVGRNFNWIITFFALHIANEM